jgi:hypothetical protein
MQGALYTVEKWCDEVGLSVNPGKTDLVVFTKKRKLDGFFEPLLFGVTLHRSESVRYLGVTLDNFEPKYRVTLLTREEWTKGTGPHLW